jgi:hypothetical protein
MPLYFADILPAIVSYLARFHTQLYFQTSKQLLNFAPPSPCVTWWTMRLLETSVGNLARLTIWY